jgi:signal transduction histidine kinase
MMVHDVKNPLSAAMGAISFLMEEPGDEQKQHTLLKVAMNNCRAAVGLMERVLEIERLEAAELVPKKRPAEIPALLRACVDEIAGNAALAAVQVSCAADAGLPEVQADPEMFPAADGLSLSASGLAFSATGDGKHGGARQRPPTLVCGRAPGFPCRHRG